MTSQPSDDERPSESLTGKEVYHIVTDVAVGPNVRLRDNLIQGAVILVCLLIGAGIGALVIADRIAGCLLGGFIGLLTGLLGSGAFLMIYRALRHARGRHD